MRISPYLDYEVILANRACPVAFAVHCEAPVLGQARPGPAAFCLVLDRSGSMNGEPLAKAKQAALLDLANPPNHHQAGRGKCPISTTCSLAVPALVAGRKRQYEPVQPQIRAGAGKGISGAADLPGPGRRPSARRQLPVGEAFCAPPGRGAGPASRFLQRIIGGACAASPLIPG
jgi:hypothetical protein